MFLKNINIYAGFTMIKYHLNNFRIKETLLVQSEDGRIGKKDFIQEEKVMMN